MSVFRNLFLILLSISCLTTQARQKKKHPKHEMVMMTLDSFSAQNLGKMYPDFTFKTSEGKEWSSINTRGKVVFLNFWFEACVPCRVEFEAINNLYDSLKNDTNIVFVAPTFEPADKLPAITARQNLRYPVASNPEEDCQRLIYYVGYPTTIILDKSGKIALYETGGHLEKAAAETFIFQKVLPTIRSLTGN